MIKNDEKSLLTTKDAEAVKIHCVKSNYFGEALRELRLEKGFSQKDAAAAVDITQAQWSGYELGKSRPTLDMIILIAQVMNFSPFVLINRSLDKSKFFDSAVELSFEDFTEIENSVEDMRKRKLQKKMEAISL